MAQATLHFEVWHSFISKTYIYPKAGKGRAIRPSHIFTFLVRLQWWVPPHIRGIVRVRRPPVLQQPGRHTLRDWWRWRKGREWRREELTILVSLVLRVRGEVMGVSRIWMLRMLRHCYGGSKNRKSFCRCSRLCLCCYEVGVVEVISRLYAHFFLYPSSWGYVQNYHVSIANQVPLGRLPEKQPSEVNTSPQTLPMGAGNRAVTEDVMNFFQGPDFSAVLVTCCFATAVNVPMDRKRN